MKRKFSDDYKNTGIYERNTQDTETKETNTLLKDMYQKWLECFENITNELDTSKFNGLQYLTCFDSYLNKSSKIMVFGREANTQDYYFKNYKTDFKDVYQHDLCYSYEYAIAHPYESYAKDRKNTFYLKTRKLICGFKDDKPDEASICSVLINNLNKSSFMGKYTPCFHAKLSETKKSSETSELINKFDKAIYHKFSFNGLEDKNVFIHELNILRPTHLIFLCGKGYDNHIKRNFGDEFFNKIQSLIEKVSSKKNPVSDMITLNQRDIEDLFSIKDYKGLNIIFATHPSSPMKREIRDKYKNKLERFIKIQNK